MKIAMISTPFVAVPPRDYGGTELVIYELVEGLVARGHDVTLFATGDSAVSGELRYLYGEAQWPPDVMTEINHTTWALQQVLEEDFDVVHAHSAGVLAYARLTPTLPLVYTMHHVRDEALSAFYRYFPDAHYVAISHDQARREITLPQVTVVHHGLDVHRFECAPRAGDYVTFIGRFAEVKGVHRAIDAAERAGVPIRVAGQVHPPDREFGAREVQPRLDRPHVRYLGRIGVDQKVPLLRGARALLMPITWDEPFGLVMIEAMLAGCPVVAFARGSVTELVEPGVTGYIVRDVDEMAEVIRPGGPLDVVDRFACRACAVQRFARERMVREYERVYAHAAAGHVPRRPPARWIA
ncbi:MAG TPA: glycosyltransferase family 4 protein [Gemmatimonadaceae bacterium]|nr:glycosyltransferase family 4 protein [Gemmatimonadaceae bacterium]